MRLPRAGPLDERPAPNRMDEARARPAGGKARISGGGVDLLVRPLCF